MQSIQRHKTLMFMAISAILLVSCNTDRPEDMKKEFALSTRVQSLDYGGTSIWGTEAELGVFVTKPGTLIVTEENFNLRYTTTFQTQATELTPAGEKMSLPEKGELVDILIYYPYNSSLAAKDNRNTIYNVDLHDQDAREPEILLIGMQSDCSSTINSATVSLRPVFAKLNVRLRNEMATKSATQDIQLHIEKIRCKAEVDILTGEYLSYGAAEDTRMLKPMENIYAYEAILPAQELDKDTNLKVIFPESIGIESLELNLIESLTTLEQNCQYDLEVTVSPEGIRAVLVSMSEFSISDWYEDTDDIFGNIKH